MKANIGDKIRKVRELKGFTQDFMAGKLEMSQRAYSKIENNDIKLDWGRIEDISKILQIEPTDLVSFDDSLVFNNCTQSGKNNTNTIHNNFPAELKKSYEDRIEHLETEVLFLRGMLEKS
ncbi:helix-turn-helix domain-containing protein [Flavobacterium yafengii]|uniref:helix-turn-helix domain-containing protein n=1 Tax=Flavobacterium yafengii TaxID=3041253 RepID=UPI0024A7DD0E|nr:helix-turn-helix transcriptional regulator [Flavobacterium yafengii]MDI5896610.1 helix-turn-helix transcriptional regulator [Flavobacterium yafengii]